MDRFDIVFFIAVATFMLPGGSSTKQEDDYKEYVLNLRDLCQKQHNPSQDSVDAIENFQLETTPSEDEMCYMKCLLTDNGKHTKMDSVELRRDYTKYIKALFSGSDVQKAQQIFDDCVKTSPTNDLDSCDSAYQVTKCFKSEAREAGLQYRTEV